jgi:hypothetical protein
VLRQAKGGIVVDSALNQSSTFLGASRRLFEEPDLRAQLGRNARHYAERTFVMSRIGAQFDRVLFGDTTHEHAGERPRTEP